MGIADDVRDGLTDDPKHLPPHLLYDDLGTTLFEAITRLPEYYLTRTEQAILDAHVDDILDRLPPLGAGGTGEGSDGRRDGVVLAELGSGSGKKTKTIIRALVARQDRLTYCPIDVSEEALELAGGRLKRELPAVEYKPIVARYGEGLARLGGDPRPKLVCFIGSSIGNFEPPDAAALLARARDAMGPDDRFLLGTDMDKDPGIVEPAYDDAIGLTAAFNRNILARINRELGADFDPMAFDHRPVFNRHQHRMEMYLVSRRDQEVRIDDLDLTVSFEEGEAIHTEYSYKFTDGLVEGIVAKAGLAIEASWYDERRWFGLHLLKRAGG